MRLFVYEHLTAGGGIQQGEAFPSTLWAEGHAMAYALVADLQKMPGIEVRLLVHSEATREPFGSAAIVVNNPKEREAAFMQAVQWAEGAVLIAPESGDVLYELARNVPCLGGRLLSPNAAFIQIAADKQRTAGFLEAAGVPVPTGCVWAPGANIPVPFPLVVKPIDGCGSQDVRRIESASELPTNAGPWRLESFCGGQSVSVAFLCGPDGLCQPLPACTQRLTNDGRFQYLGGHVPLSAGLNERAQRLALRAIAALSVVAEPLGYVGVDLILGVDDEGREDIVIEINPRLTTSFVGLRQACRGNLGEAMIRLALGESHAVEFSDERIEFDASGKWHAANAPLPSVSTPNP